MYVEVRDGSARKEVACPSSRQLPKGIARLRKINAAGQNQKGKDHVCCSHSQ